jgi:hypothetical protein
MIARRRLLATRKGSCMSAAKKNLTAAIALAEKRWSILHVHVAI